MSENGNGARRTVTLPGGFTTADVEALRKVIFNSTDILDDQNTKFQAFLSSVERSDLPRLPKPQSAS
jgi:hypothetical protein